MTPNKPKAYSYIRFSNAAQAQGDSYRRQREAAESYCAQHGLELVDAKEYSFFDQGKSAFKARHLDDTGELARFLSFVEDGTIPQGSTLLVESLDRLSREKVKDALPRFLDLLNKGINVVTLADGRLYTSQYNELDLIISIVQMSRAHEESLTKGKRVSAAWRAKQEQARSESLPIGKLRPLWLDYSNNGYVVIPERADIVRRIFKMAQDGYGHRTIAAELNRSGVPSFSAGRKNATGLWANSSISHILKNRSVLGEYQPHQFVDGKRVPVGLPVKEFYPVIITEDEFYAAQQAVSSRRQTSATKPGKSFNVWQGIAVCGFCNGPMHISKRNKSRILRCFRRVQGVCEAKPIMLPRSEEVFREILAKVDSLSLVQGNHGKLRRQIAVYDGKIFEVQGRLESIQSELMNLNGKIPISVITVMQQLEEELSRYKQAREEVKELMAREKVLDKQDFFRRLDLETYEGRARANSLLKSLRIKVRIQREGKERGSKAPVAYLVDMQKGTPFIFQDLNGSLEFFPLEKSLLELGQQQGENIPELAKMRIFALEERREWLEKERIRLKEMTKSHSYREIAEIEGLSVREVKRRLGV